MADDDDVLRELSDDVAARRVLLREFETVARGVLGEDPDAAGFAVTGALVSIPSMAVRPRFTGVPAGSRPHPEGSLMPDRPMMVELIARTWDLRSRRWDPIDLRVADPDPGWVTPLRLRWPGIFTCEVSCGAGWADLIEAVAGQLKERGELVPFTQIKEKYGELRMYSDGALALDGFDLQLIAEIVSGHVCEVCGAPGLTAGENYLLTLCDRHRREIQQ